ncbi:MAG: hypothetical protein AB7E49_08040 [Campylobacterales bacterium]
MLKANLQQMIHKEQKLILIQIVVFTLIMAILIVVGALVYHKTSIHDREEAIEQKRSIEGGFQGLQKAVEEQ